MVQRVAAIESLLKESARTYVCGAYCRHWKVRSYYDGNLTVYYVNFFAHFFLTLSLILRARCVYVHSVFHAMFALPAYFMRNCVITDIHGVVPEETQAEGKAVKALIFGCIERIVVKRSRAIICVTRRMAGHLVAKYGRTAPSILLPIFEQDIPVPPRQTLTDGPISVIYAGGTQVWQNIDLMLRSAAKYPRYRYIFMTPNPEQMRASAGRWDIRDAEFSSGTRADVVKRYATADLGFLLRDDSTINNVACPTKAIEYLASGVVPVVLNNRIGDFADLGAQFLLLDELAVEDMRQKLNDMRTSNYACLRRLTDLHEQGWTELSALLENLGCIP
ncbi:MAG TPA: hypothetical protein DD502_05490 [Cupriavidus sp.]|nr:hypothetical protein [Cupriavidus sp.]